MTRKSLPHFDAAMRAAKSYVHVSIRARDAQYRFLALAYIAFREGQQRQKSYAKQLERILGRGPTGPERKREFLHLLHALLGSEDDAPPSTLPQFSRLTTALEEIHRAFADSNPVGEDIRAYIRDAGGVGGLNDLSRLGEQEHGETSQEQERSGRLTNVVSINPGDIELPALRGHVTKVGRGYRLRLSEFAPGEYSVRIVVGQGGFVQAILDPDASDENAA